MTKKEICIILCHRKEGGMVKKKMFSYFPYFVIGLSALLCVKKGMSFFLKTHTGNLLYKSLVKSVDLSVSEDVDKVISFLCNDSIKNQYIDLLVSDKSWMLQYLSLVSSSVEHRFTDLYNRETDDIKWDQVLNNVLFNSEQLLD